jgi:hypothetical protein
MNSSDNTPPEDAPTLRKRYAALWGKAILSQAKMGNKTLSFGEFDWIKQHLFCKSGFSEVGHLASMFR